MSMLRRMRAATTIAAAWAIAWMLAAYGVLLYFVLKFHNEITVVGPHPQRDALLGIALFGVGWALVGAINGFSFAMLLTGYGRRPSARVNLPAVALLGAIAGAILPLIFAGALVPTALRSDEVVDFRTLVAVILLGGTLGALSALGTFAIARHGALQEGA